MKKDVEKKDIERKDKKMSNKENRQLMWFFFWIIIAFAAFLVPYFIMEGAKKFEYGSALWTIENYENLKIFHGRFLVFNGENVNYNIYLRNDPRENDVYANGDFSYFKIGGFISISPEIDQCRGEISRALVDLGAFIKKGIGADTIAVATNDKTFAADTGKKFVNCSTYTDRTVVILEKGESSVLQSKENNFCYTIAIKDCEDLAPIEKFMIKSISDYNQRY